MAHARFRPRVQNGVQDSVRRVDTEHVEVHGECGEGGKVRAGAGVHIHIPRRRFCRQSSGRCLVSKRNYKKLILVSYCLKNAIDP